MNKGRPSRGTPRELQKRIAWGLVCRAISSSSGLSAPKLEQWFNNIGLEVGDGSGRRWRYYCGRETQASDKPFFIAERLADSLTREAIIQVAEKEGWLDGITTEESEAVFLALQDQKWRKMRKTQLAKEREIKAQLKAWLVDGLDRRTIYAILREVDSELKNH